MLQCIFNMQWQTLQQETGPDAKWVKRSISFGVCFSFCCAIEEQLSRAIQYGDDNVILNNPDGKIWL